MLLSAQDSPHNKEHPAPNVNSVAVEKPQDLWRMRVIEGQ